MASLNLSHFLNVDDDPQDSPTSPSWAPAPPSSYPQLSTVVKVEDTVEDANWAHLIRAPSSSSRLMSTSTATSMEYDDSQPPVINCIPGGLAQISMPESSRSPSPDMALPGSFFTSQQRTIALNPSALLSRAASPPPAHQPKVKKSSAGALGSQPHPYSISPSNTTALFTRASSVSSNNNNNASSAANAKKSRAPPSGPISTKDFIPPDVSGLSKREARLVKNRAAAFLSRQRKREEFEGLETRVDALEEDNARLYKELEAYRSGAALPLQPSADPPASSSPLSTELAGLKRQLASRDAELAKLHSRLHAVAAAQEELAEERARAAEREREVEDLQRRLAAVANGGNVAVKKEEESDESDSEDSLSTVGEGFLNGKKDLKAGSMAFMVLLFSLSTLLTNGSNEATGSAKPPVASERVRRPGFGHHRDSSRSSVLGGAYPFPDVYSSYDTLATPTAADSMMFSPSFGFEEDMLLSSSVFSPNLASGGLSDASAFASLAARPSTATTGPPADPALSSQDLQRMSANSVSGVRSIGPDEFEFDFTLPQSPSAESSGGEKKVKVRVKSALPLNLNLGALNAVSSKMSAAAQKPAMATDRFGSTFPSPFEFQPDDDLDVATLTSAPWSAVTESITSSVSSPASDSSSRKRKHVGVSSEPPAKRRLSDDAGNSWFDDDIFDDDEDIDDIMANEFGFADEDVQMRA